jgi:hypothetical protein
VFVSAFLHTASLREKLKPPGGLLLPAQGKSLASYITPLSYSKWDHWREDWMIAQTGVHDQLELSPMPRWVGAFSGRRFLIYKAPMTLCLRGSSSWWRRA